MSKFNPNKSQELLHDLSSVVTSRDSSSPCISRWVSKSDSTSRLCLDSRRRTLENKFQMQIYEIKTLQRLLKKREHTRSSVLKVHFFLFFYQVSIVK